MHVMRRYDSSGVCTPGAAVPQASTVASFAELRATLHSASIPEVEAKGQSRRDASVPVQSTPDIPGGMSFTRTWGVTAALKSQAARTEVRQR